MSRNAASMRCSPSRARSSRLARRLAAWSETGRRTKLPDGVQYPALIQIEGDCDYQSKLGQLRRREEQVTLLVYHNVGADQASRLFRPFRDTQDFKDRVDAKFGDQGVRLETLGGLVFAAWINGAIRRYPGDLDGIELITIPISLLLP
jgi:hypothetical protein